MSFPSTNKNKAQEKVLESSHSLIASAKKVIKYRKHLLDANALASINLQISMVENSIRAKDFANLEGQSNSLSRLLKQHGGDIAPETFLGENMEALFVAILLAIAIRTFFIQSFQIPTNSMAPTYYGMTCKLVNSEATAAGIWTKVWHKIKFCSREVNVVAENRGTVSIPLSKAKLKKNNDVIYVVPYEEVFIKKYLGLVKAKVRKYTIFVDRRRYQIISPIDLSLDKILLERFCRGYSSWEEVIAGGKFDQNFGQDERISILHTKYPIAVGDSIIRFEILSGDMLFVDKVSFHFRPPKVGESVVFTTNAIEPFAKAPKFFIKRLVGKPTNILNIENNQLFMDGKLVTTTNGILEKINSKAEGYENGYCPAEMLAEGLSVTVPEKNLFVLGDNSKDSYDSRFWGFVPEKSICGRPFIIFYPFTNRWGKCK
ncbi:MAG: signal peptidase I [Puniceicoccales bacterium]|jgi:signal peptidase I|nr:signal peptidase I [Puniceicoccales bacterium]